MYDLSILVPGIHNERWPFLYNSIQKSASCSWELIFVGPYPLPSELQNKSNVKYIQDYGQPTRRRQQALIASEGQWIFYGGDDVTFFPNSIDYAFEQLKNYWVTDKTVLLGKYTEGKRDNPEMLSDKYYTFAYHDSTRPIQQWLPYHAWIIMAGLILAKLIKDLGGWDCQFQVCAIGCLDLALRMQNYGIDLQICHQPFFHAEHLPNMTGDHGPIAHAQIYYDLPLLYKIYCNPSANQRTYININNWENTSKIWNLRFKNE